MTEEFRKAERAVMDMYDEKVVHVGTRRYTTAGAYFVMKDVAIDLYQQLQRALAPQPQEPRPHCPKCGWLGIPAIERGMFWCTSCDYEFKAAWFLREKWDAQGNRDTK